MAEGACLSSGSSAAVHKANYQLNVSCTLTRHSADDHNVWGDSEAVSHRASVYTGVQNHRLFFLEVWPT